MSRVCPRAALERGAGARHEFRENSLESAGGYVALPACVQSGMDETEREVIRAEGLDPDDPAVQRHAGPQYGHSVTASGTLKLICSYFLLEDPMNQCPHCGGGLIQTVQVGEGGAWAVKLYRSCNCGVGIAVSKYSRPTKPKRRGRTGAGLRLVHTAPAAV